MKIMNTGLGAILSLALLGGCVSDEELQAQQLQDDRSQCSALGFPSGSTAMASCMNTASNRRAEREAREAANDREWSREYDRKEQKKKDKKNDKKKSRENDPTILRIPGADPATANLSLCSDGALREDCADAPNGY